MAQSDNLRHIQRLSGGGKTTYKEGAKTENMVATAVQCVFKTLKNNHRKLEFMHMKKHSKQMFAESIGVVDYVPSNGKSFVNPDGGTIWVKKTYSDGSTWYPILTSEAKKQGTNDKLLAEGKKKQAQGNAIERAYKNIEEFRCLYEAYPWFSYFIFCEGCDFEEGSSILDRMDAMTRYRPRNKSYVTDEKQLVSLYIKPEGFEQNFIYTKMLESAELIIKIIEEES